MIIPQLPVGRSMGICAAFVENFGADEGNRCSEWLGRIGLQHAGGVLALHPG